MNEINAEIVATIKPCHLHNIRTGKKLWEIRKTIPHNGMPFKVFCCESGSGGKVKAEFVVDMFEVAPWKQIDSFQRRIDESHISTHEAKVYSNCCDLYFWHISEMIDYTRTPGYKVRHISEFGLKRAPQSWCYVKRGD